jgi:hypothetical protein
MRDSTGYGVDPIRIQAGEFVRQQVCTDFDDNPGLIAQYVLKPPHPESSIT